MSRERREILKDPENIYVLRDDVKRFFVAMQEICGEGKCSLDDFSKHWFYDSARLEVDFPRCFKDIKEFVKITGFAHRAKS